MDDLIYYFVDDNELLELINSDVSYTLNDDSIVGSKALAKHYILGYLENNNYGIFV